MASKPGSKRGKKEAVESSPSLSDPGLLAQVAAETAKDSSVAPAKTSTTSSATTTTTMERKSMSEGMSMMEFSQDLAEAEAPPPLPPGEYPAEIVKAELKTSAKGNTYLAVMFRVEPDSYPADFQDGNPEGETLAYNRVQMQDNAQGRYRVRKFLESVGAKLSRQVDPNDLVGLTATVGITHSTWEGETRAEIAKVLAA